MNLNVKNETATLKTVVLGQPLSLGKIPSPDEAYDAKSYESIKNDHYPKEKDIIDEMNGFQEALVKYNVQVLRPDVIENCNQVFSRDVAFVIDDKIIISNIIPDRVDEQDAYRKIFRCIDFKKIYNLPDKAHMEGGDVILHNDTIFIGFYGKSDYSGFKTARTNTYAIDFLKELFPHKTILPLQLIKNDTNPYKCILHLDCTFMPVGNNKALVYKDGFETEKDHRSLVDFFGKSNIFEITKEEMYNMNTNIFSISPEIVVSEQNFTRLNQHLENEWNIAVERIPYSNIARMGGLLRCSTLPLIRS